MHTVDDLILNFDFEKDVMYVVFWVDEYGYYKRRIFKTLECADEFAPTKDGALTAFGHIDAIA